MKKIKRKQKLQPTKKTELITPSSKITPPPPPSYLNKNSHPKHLSLLKQFTLILFTAISIAACNVTENNEAKTSSQAEITELTVTINSTDYPITFNKDKTTTVTIPYVSTLPAEITVKSTTISSKASGLATNDTLKISSGKVNITITAEDGSTTVYTLNVEIEDPLFSSVQTRSEITYHSEDVLKPDNYRTHILPFTIKAGSAEAEGEYHLAVRKSGSPVPTATDIRDSSAVIVRSLTVDLINVFLSFHMDTDLFDSTTEWTDNSDASILTYDMVDAALLQPETEYKLYAVAASGSDTVYTLLTHSTDAEPALSLVTNINSDYDMFYSVPIEHTYTIRKGEPFLLWVGIVNIGSPLAFNDSHYQTDGVDDTVTIVLTSGSIHPPISGEDSSIFFAAKVENKIGRYVMISKNTHANTASVVSGMNFRMTSISGSDSGEYLFIWE